MRPADVLDPTLVLIRRVRWRRNVETFQRAAYGAVALGTTAAAALVLLLLAAPAEVVALGIMGIASALVVALAMGLARIRRRWLDGARAAAWIDASAALDHRLVTLVARRDHPSALLPLLAVENVERLEPWTAERLVPDRVPWAHLGVALATSYALVLAVVTAPRWQPPDVPIAPADGRVAKATDARLTDLTRRRIATAGRPDGAGTASDDAAGATAGTAGTTLERRSLLPRLAGSLQRALRERLWGARWARMASASDSAASRDETDAASDGSARDDAPRSATSRAGAATRAGRPGDARDATRGSGGTRAGAGTDPNLFGTAEPADGTAPGRFPVGLAALVRGKGGEARPPRGDEAPAAEPDVHPELAPVPLPPLPLQRTPVPPEWEAAVRAVFTHREGDAP